MTDPDSRHGIRVLTSDAGSRYTPYDELACLAAATARRCVETAGSGSSVALCCQDPRNFVTGLFGALTSGAKVCGLPPPTTLGSGTRYVVMIAERLATFAPAIILCDTATEDVVRRAASPDTPVIPVAETADGTAPGPAVDGGAIVQFTSGSTSASKSVLIEVPALESNIAAITEWLGLGEGDGTSSWLPLHHDMGLVGCLLTPLTNQRPIWLMSPQQFVRRPAAWLRTFEEGATTTAAPPFGYEYCVQRVSRRHKFDLSRWRVAIVGAEWVRHRSLRDFADRFGDYGFVFDAFRPSYGLAEATLAVTGRPASEPVRAIEVDRRSIREGATISVAGKDVRPENRVTVVSCGHPLRDYRVEIQGPDGKEVEPGRIGEIVVHSSALGRYSAAGDVPIEGTRFRDGALWTRDLGFIDNGELFCLGRIGDGIKVRGTFVSAEVIEQSVADQLGVSSDSTVALLGMTGATGHLVILLDRKTGIEADQAYHAAWRVTTGTGLDVTVGLCPHQAIERTTSGKPRRRSMWSAFLDGRLDDYLVRVGGPPLAGPVTISAAPGRIP